MPTLADTAHIAIPDTAYWSSCTDCGQLFPATPDTDVCPPCSRTAIAAAITTVGAMGKPAIIAIRDLYTSGLDDRTRLAVLIEIAGAAAALARTIAKHRHIPAGELERTASDPVDVRAVLGHGSWLPTMTRHIPVPTPVRVRAPRRGAVVGKAA
jgi:hypothetical protein